jgi:hypothetical protein
VRYVALIEDATEEVYKDCDYTNDGEDGTRADRLFCWLCGYAGCFGEDFEVV